MFHTARSMCKGSSRLYKRRTWYGSQVWRKINLAPRITTFCTSPFSTAARSCEGRLGHRHAVDLPCVPSVSCKKLRDAVTDKLVLQGNTCLPWTNLYWYRFYLVILIREHISTNKGHLRVIQDHEYYKYYNFYIKVKGNWSRYRPGVAQRVVRSIALLFHDRGTRRGWVVSSTPRPHLTPGKGSVRILQEAGWAPGTVWLISVLYVLNIVRCLSYN